MATQGGEEFSLKWNDHSKVFFAGAEDLAEKQEFTDVTLAAGGKLITAHKMVLSICSPFFQRLFKQLGTVGPEKTVVYLKDVQPRHLDLLKRLQLGFVSDSIRSFRFGKFLQPGILFNI